MKILVCISNVPDTTTKVRFTDNNTRFETNDVQWIINPWDELALTRALEIKEKSGGAVESVVVAHVGLQTAEPTLRKALAVGADSAIRVNAEPTDSYFVAAQLAEVLKTHSFDIIMCGIESSDYNNSSVGGQLSEMLGYSSVSAVSYLDLENKEVKLKREIDGGDQQLSVSLPLIAIVQKGIAIEPRIPAMRGIMAARTKPIEVIEPATLEPLTEYVDYELPPAKAACKMVEAENASELITLLHTEAKVI